MDHLTCEPESSIMKDSTSALMSGGKEFKKPAEVCQHKVIDELNVDMAFLLTKQQKGIGDMGSIGKDLKVHNVKMKMNNV